MRDVDAGERELTGETQALHSRITKLEQVSHNLPGHKNVDEELDRAWREWKSTFDAIKDSIILTDGEFKIIQANLASSQLFGRPLDQVIGKTCWQLVHGTNEAPEGCPLKRAKTTKKHEEMEVYLPQKGIWAADSVDPVLDEQGRLTGVVHIIRDITQRKQAEEEIAKLAKFPSENPYPVLRIHKNGTVLYANKASEGLLKARSSGMGQPAPAEWHRLVKKTLSSGQVIREETKHEGRVFAFRAVPITESNYVNFYGVDITEHKLTDEMLRELKHRYQTLFESVPVGIGLATHEGRVLECNGAMLQMTGYSLAEFKQINLKDTYQEPQSREVLLRRLQEDGFVRDLETQMKRKDGTAYWASLTVTPFTLGGHEVLLTVQKDMTEHKKAEEAMHFTRFALDNAVETMVCLGQDASYIDANDTFCRSVGYSREELLSMTAHDIDPNYSAKIWPEFWKKLKQSGSLTFESCHRTKDGKVFPVEVTVTFFKYKGKEYHCGFARDITERKKMEKELREKEKKWTSLTENTNDIIMIVDNKGELQYINKTIPPYTPKETVGKSVYEYVPIEQHDKMRNLLTNVFKTGKPETYEVSSVIPKLGTIWFSTKVVPIKIEENVVNAILISTDITERKEAEQKLIDYQTQLKSLASQLTLAEERERHRLATELHDRIGQSLVISKIKLDALRKSGRSRKLDKSLEDICNSIGQTIQDTRTLTFDLSSPVLYELGFETAVSEWLTDRIQKRHGITVEFEDDGEPKPLDDDVRILLFRDVRELLTNVVKHAQTKKVKVSIRKVGSEIHISVEDDGWGFDTKKVAATAARKGGFGLFSIRERLDQIGGHLEIESEPGCGCKVTMTAPLKRKEITDGRNKTTR